MGKLADSAQLSTTGVLSRSDARHRLVKQVKITSASEGVLGQLVLTLSQRRRNHQSHLGSLQIFHVLVKIILAGDGNNISVRVIVPEFNSINLKIKVGKGFRCSLLKIREAADVPDLFDLETVSEFHRCHLVENRSIFNNYKIRLSLAL